ncbi:MAG: cbb3-type cytochrome c oxidase subunit II [Proteobacteria bacterium]|nr:cbb3-type cytochrome c oxidase subunit II [Pseudomonadota bacterium]MBU1737889.1 cbb3-type cytochrome c oxidase subunit II [Pseudomonadota bacterium]
MWDKKPVLLLVLATIAILVGTIITMVLPFATINTSGDRIESVKPYTAVQLAGRDVYIREGCNNCHTQTVRPLVSDVVRYGEYSKSGEFVYDQPHLWGSRRTGPDLARIGGKYPDGWHLQHMRNPTSLVPRSNMPVYAFLDQNTVDPEYTRKKMDILGFPYTEADITGLQGVTEMTAMVAYLQKLGSDIPWRKNVKTEIIGPLTNPYLDDATVLEEGRSLYAADCAACHGSNLKGGIAADISDLDMPDADLFKLIYNGIEDSNMPSFAKIGQNKIWKIVSFIKAQKRH